MKLDFDKTNRRGYVQNGGGFDPKSEGILHLAPTGSPAGKCLGKGFLSNFPCGQTRSYLPTALARGRRSLAGVAEECPWEVAARGARPHGAPPPGGADSNVLHKAPNPSPGPTPSPAPAWGRRESGAAAVARLRLAPGRGGGGEKRVGRRPALPSGPGEGAAGTRHSLPGD